MSGGVRKRKKKVKQIHVKCGRRTCTSELKSKAILAYQLQTVCQIRSGHCVSLLPFTYVALH